MNRRQRERIFVEGRMESVWLVGSLVGWLEGGLVGRLVGILIRRMVGSLV